MARRVRLVAGATCLLAAACASPYESHLGLRWDARDEILLSDESQVRVRDAQSRVYDTSDKRRALAAVVATFQDLGFQIGVLDDALGIVSGKSFVALEEPPATTLGIDPTSLLYSAESLVVLSPSFRTWGPFWNRDNLVRLTVTVRSRNAEQLVVRASAQYCLQPVEDPEPYRSFFALLARQLALEAAAE
ncbi:MAG TPA: hypothetical protein VMW19_20770 [Myxococcota bacterium]|nr:hypothetical protein [Myxococcota bacterium]